MLNKFFSKIFKFYKTNIFLFSLLLTQIVLPTFELFKPNSAYGNTALGSGATASGSNSTAIGPAAEASGSSSTALGEGATASGTSSTALGAGAAVSGSSSNALGNGALASGTSSNALGKGASASHDFSTAIGAFATTDKDNQIVLGRSTETVTVKGNLVVGVDGDYTLITREGLTVDGKSVIKKENDGSIHIGENSLITIEEDGKQKLYGQDASGNAIPIDITNGSKLLINGRDVEQSINNVGALSAALTGLPTVPTDTTLACGLGTGTHGGDFAFSGGCASKVNEKLSFNYAASMTMPGQDYAGDFQDQFSARAGFVWQLGESNKPTKISLNESKELKKEVQDLKAKNANLLARLEKLESIAFK